MKIKNMIAENMYLDELADKANFADIKESMISTSGETLRKYIKSNNYLYFQWRNFNANEVWADVEIVEFKHRLDYAGARLYHITASDLGRACSTGSYINLDELQPKYSGKRVMEILCLYAIGRG